MLKKDLKAGTVLAHRHNPRAGYAPVLLLDTELWTHFTTHYNRTDELSPAPKGWRAGSTHGSTTGHLVLMASGTARTAEGVASALTVIRAAQERSGAILAELAAAKKMPSNHLIDTDPLTGGSLVIALVQSRDLHGDWVKVTARQTQITEGLREQDKGGQQWQIERADREEQALTALRKRLGDPDVLMLTSYYMRGDVDANRSGHRVERGTVTLTLEQIERLLDTPE